MPTSKSPSCGKGLAPDRRSPVPIALARRAEALRQLGLLSAGTAHDLRNILGALSMNLYLLDDALDHANPAVEGTLTRMRRELRLGVELLDRIRDFGRVEASAGPRGVDLDEIAVEASNLASSYKPEGRTTTVHRQLGSPSPVYGRRSELVSAVLNLLLNAIDASPGGAPVVVRTGSGRGFSFIEVEDRGLGISPEVEERMLEPFFTTKGDRGTGLGLASVAECARHHSGEIRVTTAAGRGTTMRMVLPTRECRKP